MGKAYKSVITIEAIRRRFIGVLWLLSLFLAVTIILVECIVPPISMSLYMFEAVTLILCLTLWPKVSFSTTLILLILAFALSDIINDPAPYFQSWERLTLFTMMLTLFSPLINNDTFKILRRDLWFWLVTITKIIILVEFILYIPWIIENYANNRGFMGIFGHSMLNAFIAAVASTVFLWELVDGKCANPYIGILFLPMSIVVLVASGSRCAILGFFAAAVPLFWSMRKHPKVFLTVSVTALVLITALIAIPNPLTKTLQFKFGLGEKHNSLTFSRDELWEARWNEFTENPWLGEGFCVNTYHSERFDKPNENGNYISEPGSSWLSLLANGGIISFGVFAWFNFGLLRRLYRCRDASDSYSKSIYEAEKSSPSARSKLCRFPRALLPLIKPSCPQQPLLYFSLWLLLIVHGFFEGWILYAGSLVFVFYWLLTSQITDLPSCKTQIP